MYLGDQYKPRPESKAAGISPRTRWGRYEYCTIPASAMYLFPDTGAHPCLIPRRAPARSPPDSAICLMKTIGYCFSRALSWAAAGSSHAPACTGDMRPHRKAPAPAHVLVHDVRGIRRAGRGRLLLRVLAVAFCLRLVAAVPPLVGGGGMARYFRGQTFTSDVASVRMSLPSPTVTLEAWVRPSSWYPYPYCTRIVNAQRRRPLNCGPCSPVVLGVVYLSSRNGWGTGDERLCGQRYR